MPGRTEPCPDCGNTEFTEWRSEGDLTCTRCGLVVEAHVIDERSEWRTFSDKDNNTTDPNRVGGPSNPLLQGLTTTIGRGQGDKGLSYSLNRVHARANNPDKALVDAFKQIGQLCEALNVAAAKDGACQIYKNTIDNKQLRGRSTAALVAACVFMASRNAQIPRTFKEITQVLSSDVSKKEIGRCFKELQRCKQEEHLSKNDALDVMAKDNSTVQHPSDFVKLYANQLRLDYRTNRFAQDMALLAKPSANIAGHRPWHGRTPVSIASAILYIVMVVVEFRNLGADGKLDMGGLARARRTASESIMHQVHLVSNVAEATIRQAYRDMYAHLRELVPAGDTFLLPTDIEGLPNPSERMEVLSKPLVGGHTGVKVEQ